MLYITFFFFFFKYEYFFYAYFCSAFTLFNALQLFNKYVLPFSNMSLIYTGFTVSLITGKSLLSLLHIIHVSLTIFCLSVYYKIQSGEHTLMSICFY